MPVTLPRRGRGGGGPGRRGGRDGGRGRGGRGGPLLAASVIPCSRPIQGIPPSRRLFPPSLALRLRQPLCPPLLLLSPGPSILLPLCRCRIVAILAGPTTRRGGPRRVVAREDGEAREWDNGGDGPADCGLPVHCASAAGGEGPYSPTAASFAIRDRRVPRLAGIYPRHQLQGEWHEDNNRRSDVRC